MIFLRQSQKVQERSDMQKQGSVTIFSALTFMLVASFLFALLESSRVQMLGTYAEMTSELAMESVLAEYQSELWESYGLLCLDGAYGGSQFSEEYLASVLATRIRMNLETEGDGSMMLGLKLDSAIPLEYQLMTDEEGRVFLHYISEYMKTSFPRDTAQMLYEKCLSGYRISDGESVGSSVEDAKQAIEDARIQQAQMMDTNAHGMESQGQENVVNPKDTSIELQENPLEVVLAWKQRGFLGMVVENIQDVSTATIQSTETLGKRVLQRGTSVTLSERDWYDKILATEYINQYFSNYLKMKEGRALAYEAEYIICGEDSDVANLEGVAKRLLLAREAANIVHIMLDAEKRMLATEVATALAGVTVNPAVIQIVEMGVIGAWAYVESILDVRALLHGDAIALVKSQEQWSSSVQSLSEVLEGGFRSANCENGWNYADYLRAFMLAMTDKNVAYRMMDMMEQTIRRIPVYRNCRMDYMIASIRCAMLYEAEPLFWNLSILENEKLGALQYQNTKYLSYY